MKLRKFAQRKSRLVAAIALLTAATILLPHFVFAKENNRKNQPFRHFLIAAESEIETAAETAINRGESLTNINPSQAVQEYEKALAIYRQLGNKSGEIQALIGLGIARDRLGDKQPAIDALQQAKNLTQQPEITAKIIAKLAEIYQSLGEYQQALDLFTEALSIYEKIGDRQIDEAQILTAIGSVYEEVGELNLALENYRKSGVRLRNANTEFALFLLQEETLGDAFSAFALAAKNDPDLGLPEGIERLALARYTPILEASRGKPNEEARILDKISQVYDQLAEYQRALEFLNAALPLAKQAENPVLTGKILFHLALVYDHNQQYVQAAEYYQQSLPFFRQTGNKLEEASTLYNLAQVSQKQGNLLAAKPFIETALEIIENLRTTLHSQKLRTAYFATVQNYYEFYINLLMQLHQQDSSKGYEIQAFNASEKSRARSLLELLLEAKANIRQGVDANLVAAERNLQIKLNAIEKRRVELYSNNTTTDVQKANIEAEREQLLEEYENIQTQIRATSPRYAALTQPQPLTLKEVQQQILDRDTVLLQYSLGEERSYLWVVTQDSFASYELPPKKQIERAVKEFRRKVTNSLNSPASLSQTSVSLSQMILAPVATQLDKKRLLIVPDGALHYVPFSALPLQNSKNSGQLTSLINQYEIVNLPSSSTLDIIRKQNHQRQKAPLTIAIIADPVFSSQDPRLTKNSTKQIPDNQKHSPPNLDELFLTRSAANIDIGDWERLEGTQVEAEAIMALIPPSEINAKLGFEANRQAATDPQLNQYRTIHFATHGLLNSTIPELSGIVLSLVNEKGEPQNGFLRLHDIFNLELSAELVVLSACQTGLGKEVKGEGLIGLTRGFMYAGAPRVLVSLWNVNDPATAEFMTRFYHLLFAEGKSPTEALQITQQQMQQETEWKAPYYWAAFTLQGEWK
ncbi:MAG: CHAT domain-containing protein [Kamptonema sp. SIO1D9]|nr:CHAT domain-containing protein [Kamptonema sp. SIO1D9]